MKKSYIAPKANIVLIKVNENLAASYGYTTGALRYVQRDTLNGNGTCNAYLATYNIPGYITGGVVGFHELIGSLFKIHNHIGDEAYGNLMDDVRDGSFGCFG